MWIITKTGFISVVEHNTDHRPDASASSPA